MSNWLIQLIINCVSLTTLIIHDLGMHAKMVDQIIGVTFDAKIDDTR
jgi:hypothetical protein